MSDLSIFDKHGRIRDDFSDAEIAALSPERQELWGALIAANSAMLSAEDDLRNSDAMVSQRVGELRTAEAELAAARPKITAVQAARMAARAQNTGEGVAPDPEVQRKILAAATVVDKANDSLAGARRERTAAEAKAKAARVVWSGALHRWTASGPIVKQRDLIKAVSATQAARVLAEKEATGSPASHVDAIMRSTGGRRGHSIDQPRARRMRVPSER